MPAVLPDPVAEPTACSVQCRSRRQRQLKLAALATNQTAYVAVGGEAINGEIVVERGDLPALPEKLSDGTAAAVVGFLTNGGFGALAAALFRLGRQARPGSRSSAPCCPACRAW
jgi:hypothetical protein